MKDKLIIGNEKNILFYNDENGNTKVEVLLENEDVWLNTEALASLFNIDRSGIVRHINNIYKDEELDENSTCAKIAHVQIEDISHCFSCSDAASLTLIEAIFFCLSLILRCLLLPAYHNTPASEHKPDSDEY